MKSAAMGIVLTSLVATGCSTTQPEPTRCVVPPEPEPPTVPREETECLEDDIYWRLEDREAAWRDYARELRAMLRVFCTEEEE